jgi:hypothetical protein
MPLSGLGVKSQLRKSLFFQPLSQRAEVLELRWAEESAPEALKGAGFEVDGSLRRSQDQPDTRPNRPR